MKFTTVNKAVKEPWCPMSAQTLRGMIRRGECPGMYVGNTFYINQDAFICLINELSLSPIKGKGVKTIETVTPEVIT